MYYEIADTNVRLAGSLHAWPADAGTGELPAWVWDAYHWSEHICLEMDSSTARLCSRFSNGNSLDQRLPADLWARLRALWPGSSDLAPMKQWAVLFALQTLNVQMTPGVEPQLTLKAQADQKPINYLETAGEFAALADALSDAEYARLIQRVIGDLPVLQRVLYNIHRAWLTRNIGEVERILPGTLLGLPTVANIILDARNRAWLPKVIASLGIKTRTLFAVGAAHLPGANGLLALLGREGYELRLLE
jgi:uncharacterized protein YbaP (TraB family)